MDANVPAGVELQDDHKSRSAFLRNPMEAIRAERYRAALLTNPPPKVRSYWIDSRPLIKASHNVGSLDLVRYL